MQNCKKAFTLIEILISIAIVSLIFTLTYSGSTSLALLLDDIDAELYASNIAKSGIEKFQIYHKNYSIIHSDNAWSNFFNAHTP
jgi:prepilin-type N-terminal cleavage/methylation domain-containing protein